MNFLIENLGKLGIGGEEDIQKVKKDVEEQLRIAEEDCKELENDKSLENNPARRAEAIATVAERRKILDLVRQKWDIFEGKLDTEKDKAQTALKKLIPDLEYRRKDAKSQLSALQASIFVQVFEKNLLLANELGELIENFGLAPFTAEDACQLVGLDPVEYLEVEVQKIE